MSSQHDDTGMWLVIHIPKAAGTSFRWSLEKYFGKNRIIRDYGQEASATTDVVREHLYSGDKSKNAATLINALERRHARVLVGHFPLAKYAKFFEPGKIVTFVREPLIRSCSEYLHRVRNGTFEGSLIDFFQRPGFQNQQSRLLKCVPGQAFIGIAEQYGDSLRRINFTNKWKLKTRKKNVGHQGGGQKLAESLSLVELEYFNGVNQKDLKFYRDSVQKFEAMEVQVDKTTGFLNWLKIK